MFNLKMAPPKWAKSMMRMEFAGSFFQDRDQRRLFEQRKLAAENSSLAAEAIGEEELPCAEGGDCPPPSSGEAFMGATFYTILAAISTVSCHQVFLYVAQASGQVKNIPGPWKFPQFEIKVRTSFGRRRQLIPCASILRWSHSQQLPDSVEVLQPTSSSVSPCLFTTTVLS